MPSKREQIQDELVEYIQRQGYDAPYGVLTGMRDMPNGGKIRSITFGCAATLDAELLIWSEKKFTIRAQGRLAYLFPQEYTNLEDVKRTLYEAVN